MTNTTRVSLSALFALALAACGSGSPQANGRIGTAGGTLTTASGARLDIPAGALKGETEVRMREAEPRNGASERVEVEIHGELSLAARISLRSDDSAHRKLVRIENEVEHGIETERHNEVEHAREAAVRSGGTFELRHAIACAEACGAGLECDDGVCKPHGGAEAGVAPNPDGSCDPGMELDVSDGICKPHGGDTVGTPPVNGICPDGMELDVSDGICKPHGGGTVGTPPVSGVCPDGMELDVSDGICKPHGGGTVGTPPVSGVCPDGMELDVSDGICKPHGGSGGGSGSGGGN